VKSRTRDYKTRLIIEKILLTKEKNGGGTFGWKRRDERDGKTTLLPQGLLIFCVTVTRRCHAKVAKWIFSDVKTSLDFTKL
jgi:hypothetical protein